MGIILEIRTRATKSKRKPVEKRAVCRHSAIAPMGIIRKPVEKQAVRQTQHDCAVECDAQGAQASGRVDPSPLKNRLSRKHSTMVPMGIILEVHARVTENGRETRIMMEGYKRDGTSSWKGNSETSDVSVECGWGKGGRVDG
jgi:hypothetical protein